LLPTECVSMLAGLEAWVNNASVANVKLNTYVDSGAQNRQMLSSPHMLLG